MTLFQCASWRYGHCQDVRIKAENKVERTFLQQSPWTIGTPLVNPIITPFAILCIKNLSRTRSLSEWVLHPYIQPTNCHDYPSTTACPACASFCTRKACLKHMTGPAHLPQDRRDAKRSFLKIITMEYNYILDISHDH